MTKKQADKTGRTTDATLVMPVYDDDDKKTTNLTVAMQVEAWVLEEQIEGSPLEAAKALYLIKERKLYLALGCSSFDAFCVKIGKSKTAAFKYVSLGDKLINTSVAGSLHL